MIPRLNLAALTVTLGLAATAAIAADRSSPSSLPRFAPMQAPELVMPAARPGGTDDSIRIAPKGAPAAAVDEIIDGLTAIKASRGGKKMEVPLPEGLRLMLRNPVKQGKVTPKPGGGKLVQIKDTKEFPYSAMGLLGSGCSGTVVAQRFVLTAAFCLFDVKTQKFYDNLDFFPAINGKDMPVGSVKWKDVYIPKGFAKEGALEYDFGLVVLDKPIGDEVGWMGFSHLEDFNLKQVNLTGYPWDGVPPQTSWQTVCTIDAAEANFLFYKCPGEGKVLAAMTGSPVWYKGQQDSDWYVVGVHNYAQDDKQNSWWALRINQANAETLLSWIDEANGGTGGGGKTEEDDTGDEDTSEQDDSGDEQDTSGDDPKCTCEDN